MDNKKYQTRFGDMTASEAAYTLLVSSGSRLTFLNEILQFASDAKEDVNFCCYSLEGLSYIIKDIDRDVFEAQCYYSGDLNSEPGKIGDLSPSKDEG